MLFGAPYPTPTLNLTTSYHTKCNTSFYTQHNVFIAYIDKKTVYYKTARVVNLPDWNHITLYEDISECNSLMLWHSQSREPMTLHVQSWRNYTIGHEIYKSQCYFTVKNDVSLCLWVILNLCFTQEFTRSEDLQLMVLT